MFHTLQKQVLHFPLRLHAFKHGFVEGVCRDDVIDENRAGVPGL
jgi:hypothetical protein